MRFLVDTAGTLLHFPQNIPSTASVQPTVALYTPAGTALRAAATATLETTSETTSGATARGATSITFATTFDGYVGRRYGATISGRKVIVEVKAKSGAVAYLTAPVQFAIPTSTTFAAATLHTTLSAVENADVDRNYKAVWTYKDSGGTLYTEVDYYDVVNTVDYYPTQWVDVLNRHGWIADEVSASNLDGTNYLETGWDMVRRFLRAQRIELDKIQTLEDLLPVHCAYINYLIADESFNRNPQVRDRLDQAEKRLADAKDEAISNIRLVMEDDGTTAEQVNVPEFRITR